MATDIAETIREEIARQELTQYRICKDLAEAGTPFSQSNLSAFLRGQDMYLSTASLLFDYLGLEVRRKKRTKS